MVNALPQQAKTMDLPPETTASRRGVLATRPVVAGVWITAVVHAELNEHRLMFHYLLVEAHAAYLDHHSIPGAVLCIVVKVWPA